MKIEFNNQVYEVEKTTRYPCTGCIFSDTTKCPILSSNRDCIFPGDYICISIVSSQLFEL